ncbi:MAG: hypothetical protein IT305_12470 [Chloroflexi bacterium]|nr:hypothetical protein [Chloroflexota bacterium]
MIFETIHIPGLYRDLPSDPGYRDLYVDAILRILQDTEDNCVILVDDEDVIWTDIDSAVSSWPGTMAARRVKEKLKKLRKRLQIVPVQATSAPLACGRALAIAAASPNAAVLAPLTCACAPACADTRFVRPGQYSDSHFSKQRRQALHILKGHEEWSASDFEQQVLRPVFRHAKTIKLFDRYIGRHLVEVVNGRFEVRDAVDSDWRDALEWILASFASSTSHQDERNVIIYCGINGARLRPDQLRSADSLLQAAAREIGIRHGLEIETHVKVEFKNTDDMLEMRHARFIFVNQLAFEIDRGFDLLTPRSRIKDFTIKLASGREKIEAEVRRLKDVEDYLVS